MSRPRSARASAPARAGGRPGVFVQTPKSDIYVALLSIALGAILIGILLLVLTLNQYGFSTKVTARPAGAGQPLVASLVEKSSTVHL